MAGIPQVITEDRASGAQFIDGSLKFDSSKSQYLKKTFTATGNRKKNTVSFWAKRSSFGDNYQRIFNCDTGAQSLQEITLNNQSSPNQDNLVSEVYIGSQSRIRTNAVLRDTGWYHIVVVYDSLNSTQADRQIIYINGERQSINNSVGVGQIDGMFSSANEHRIGNGKNYQVPFNGSLSQFYFLDGIAAGPEEFGYTDPLTNTWRPKKYEHLSSAIATQYSGASSLTWDDNPIGSIYTLSNGNRTATAGEGSSSGYTGADVWSNAIPADSTTAWTLEITNSDSVGGWYFTDSQTPSGTHPDERGGNSLGMRNQDADAGWFGTFATANGSTSQGHILPLPGCETFGSKRVDFVVYRPASGTGKVWCKANGSSTWVGGGDPSNTSSTPSFIIPDGDTYFGYTFYDRSNGDQIATLDGDGSIQQKAGANSFYLPMDGSAPIGKDQSGRGNDWTPIGFGGSQELPKATGAIPILNTNEAGTVAKKGVRTDKKTYTVTASGGKYYLNGALTPTLNAYRGGSYTFDYTGATSHPLYLSSLQDGKWNSKAYSVEFDGTGDSCSIGPSSDFTMGTGDFTIECFVQKDNNSHKGILQISDTAGGFATTNYGTTLAIGYQSGVWQIYGTGNSTPSAESSSYPINAGQWYHVAYVRHNSVAKLYVDGVEVISRSDTFNYTGTYIGYGGYYNSSYLHDGKISNLRVVKGQALYTSNFTRPSTTLTTTSQGAIASNVKLICCQDSDATTAAVKPGDITVNGDSVARNESPFLYNTNGQEGVNTGTSNTTKITIPHWAADTLYYYCNAHSGMGSSINVTTDIRKADPYAWRNFLNISLNGYADDVSDEVNFTSTAKSISTTGASASSAQSNFYGGSYYFDGSNTISPHYLDLGNTGIPFNNNSWTIETWFYGTDYDATILHTGSGWNNNQGLVVQFQAAVQGISFYQGSGTISTLHVSYVPRNVWHHLAMVGDRQTVTLYVDGVAQGTIAQKNNIGGFGDDFLIGAYRDTNYQAGPRYGFKGYLQDFRVYSGVAKYTENFVVGSTAPDVLPDTPSGITSKTNLTNITDGAVSFDGTDGTALSLSNHADLQFGTETNWTIELFAYRTGAFINYDVFVGKGIGGTFEWFIEGFSDGSVDFFYSTDGSSWTGQHEILSNMALNRWYHIALVRNGSSFKSYIDGIETFSTTAFNIYTGTGELHIGGYNGAAGQDPPIIISNFRMVKGTSVYTSEFIPPTRELTNVTNTKLLCCQSTTSAVAAAVAPGSITANGNAAATNFNPFTDDINAIRGQASGYATLNPLAKWDGTLSNGNLTMTGGNDIPSTIGASSGKWYAEVTITDIAATLIHIGIVATGTKSFLGAANNGHVLNNMDYLMIRTDSAGPYNVAGRGAIASWSQVSDTGATFTTGDIMSIELDMDNLFIKFYKNNVLRTHFTFTLASTFDKMFFYNRNNGSGVSTWNFGQKPFKFPPPDGFQPLNLSNVQPEKVIARPDQYVGVSLWTGNGTSQTITGLKHKPDLVWIKSRSFTNNHHLFDSVRGPNNILRSSTAGEETTANVMTSFNNDGFTVAEVSGNNATNDDTSTFVGWTWKAGGNKGVFNVDDVGYANASDVNMSVGSLNSASYNTDQIWSGLLTPASGTFDQAASLAFNGNIQDGSNRLRTSDNYVVVTMSLSTPVTVSSQIKVYGGYDSTCTVTVDGTTYTSSTGVIHTFNVSGSLTQMTHRGNGTSGRTYLEGMEIDGKQLVDSNQTPPDAPSIAPTGCSVGTKQGFSIIKYQGTGGDISVPHGLQQTPDFMIMKSLDNAEDWAVYTTVIDGSYDYLYLNSTAAKSDSGITAPTNSVFYRGSADANGENIIAYLWHDVPGLQKFGTYTGNGSGASGPFVELGFRPAIIWIKDISAVGTYPTYKSWVIYDSKRPGYNVGDGSVLYANLANGEGFRGDGSADTYDENFVITSNGFKVQQGAGSWGVETNESGRTYLYCAWAEAPTVNLYGAQANAF